jgi:hypothetical protein
MEIKRIKSLEELNSPWVLLSKTNTGRVLELNENGFKFKDTSFYEVYFSGLNGPLDFFPYPISYHIQKMEKGLKIVESIPFHSLKENSVIAQKYAEKKALKLALGQSRFLQKTIKKQGIETNVYFISGKFNPSELVNHIS